MWRTRGALVPIFVSLKCGGLEACSVEGGQERDAVVLCLDRHKRTREGRRETQSSCVLIKKSLLKPRCSKSCIVAAKRAARISMRPRNLWSPPCHMHVPRPQRMCHVRNDHHVRCVRHAAWCAHRVEATSLVECYARALGPISPSHKTLVPSHHLTIWPSGCWHHKHLLHTSTCSNHQPYTLLSSTPSSHQRSSHLPNLPIHTRLVSPLTISFVYVCVWGGWGRKGAWAPW